MTEYLEVNLRSQTRAGWWYGLALLPTLLALTGCHVTVISSDGQLDAGQGCLVNGVTHDVGASFPSTDGCNTCSCAADGRVACTERACEVNECTTDSQCAQPPCACVDTNMDGECDNHCPTMGCRNHVCVDISTSTTTCGGLSGATCAKSQFCNYPVGAACGAGDQTGSCEPLPEACDDSYAPVCGCDGKTYSNACSAAAAGISVSATGECALSCKADSDCPVPDCACLDANHDGRCDNACPVFHCVDGQCAEATTTTQLQAGDSCGGLVPPGTPDCAAGLFCQSQPGSLCGAADAPGICVAVPTSCPDVTDPVCGCDGKTYPSACHASLAQAGILDLGACK